MNIKYAYAQLMPKVISVFVINAVKLTLHIFIVHTAEHYHLCDSISSFVARQNPGTLTTHVSCKDILCVIGSSFLNKNTIFMVT